jgi:hypothetical protein
VEREDIQAGMANAFSEIDKDGDGKLKRWCRIRKHVFLKVQNKTAEGISFTCRGSLFIDGPCEIC